MSLLGPTSELPFSVVEKLPHVLVWLCVVIMSENYTNISIYNDANTVCSGERQLQIIQTSADVLIPEPKELWLWIDNSQT